MTTPNNTRKPQNRAGGERRGNSKDRARRRVNLMIHWGDGETCPCTLCGRTLRNHPREAFVGGVGPADHVEADKIVPHEDGPGYIMTNLYPSCRECNLARGDRDFLTHAASLGIDGAAIVARAATYRPRRGKRA